MSDAATSTSTTLQHPLRLSWSLSGKTYVVTGGARGIGLTTIRTLLSHDASGIVFCSKSSDCTAVVSSLREEFPCLGDDTTKIVGVQCDVATPEGRTKLVQVAKETFDNKLNGLINNVGMNVRKSIMDQTTEEYHDVMKTNVDSAYFLCREFKDMLINGGKRDCGGGGGAGSTIVNVSSAAGLQSSGTGAVYGLSKAALIHFTKILACEWAQYNIRVNAVAPWMTMTPMLEDAVRANPTQLDKVREWTPMHRLSTPEEVAAPIVFLCMPCSGYVTGQCLGIDGGLTAQGFDGPVITPP